MKTGNLFLSMVSEVTFRKISKQTSPQVYKITIQELVLGFWTVTSNHKVKDQVSVEHLFLIKNIMWDGFYGEGFQVWTEYALYILLVEIIPTRFVD